MPKRDVNSTNSKGPRLRNSYGIEDLGGTCKIVRFWNFSLVKTLQEKVPHQLAVMYKNAE